VICVLLNIIGLTVVGRGVTPISYNTYEAERVASAVCVGKCVCMCMCMLKRTPKKVLKTMKFPTSVLSTKTFS
jgi:hypothetical protein